MMEGDVRFFRGLKGVVVLVSGFFLIFNDL